nr:BPK_HP1_G0043540.mRNA.1.CDS.1 [Saccharomyces cerevisiae]
MNCMNNYWNFDKNKIMDCLSPIGFQKKLQDDFSYETFETDLGGTGCCLLRRKKFEEDPKIKS